MTEIASQFLATFDALPANEQKEILLQLLLRTSGIGDTALDEDELTTAADELFQTLDAEESNDSFSEPR